MLARASHLLPPARAGRQLPVGRARRRAPPPAWLPPSSMRLETPRHPWPLSHSPWNPSHSPSLLPLLCSLSLTRPSGAHRRRRRLPGPQPPPRSHYASLSSALTPWSYTRDARDQRRPQSTGASSSSSPVPEDRRRQFAVAEASPSPPSFSPDPS